MFNNLKSLLIGILSAASVMAVVVSACTAFASPARLPYLSPKLGVK